MYELIPILAGSAGGLLAAHLGGSRGRAALIAAVAVLAGFGAASLSGEIAESWGFVIWDTAQAAVAATLTCVLVSRWRRPA